MARFLLFCLVVCWSGHVSGNSDVGCHSSDNHFYDSTSSVISLCENNFFDQLKTTPTPWIVEFFAPWCGHCRALAPEFEALAAELKDQVAVGAVDCTLDTDLCADFLVSGFPTLLIFPQGSGGLNSAVYSGPRTAEAMADFLTQDDDEEASERKNTPAKQKMNGGADGVVSSFYDVDLTTIIRCGLFFLHLGNAIALCSTSDAGEPLHWFPGFVHQSRIAVALAVAAQASAAVSALLWPCSLACVCCAAWGYAEAFVFAADTPVLFMTRSPFWILPLSLLWLQAFGHASDHCPEATADWAAALGVRRPVPTGINEWRANAKLTIACTGAVLGVLLLVFLSRVALRRR